ncbi:MAG: hypothetical protein HQ522_18605 [Bacteroidetes bacterium]|nr:hypothetical protein [Bacteroidota bacterium]
MVFDRGLIAISDKYKVLVHPRLIDYNPDSGIRQYENREIILPEEEKFYPSLKTSQTILFTMILMGRRRAVKLHIL